MRPCHPLIACLVFLACAPRGRESPPDPRTEVWVAAARRDPGDGSRVRPFPTLGEALGRAGTGARPLRVHLAPGRYGGPFVLPAGAELLGEGEVVLALEGAGDGAVVRAPQGASLRGLQVHGGTWGVEAGGTLHLESVRLVGQEAGGLWQRGGVLEAREAHLEAGGPEAVGLRLEGGRARVEHGVFQGAFRRSVEARGAEVELEEVALGTSRTALHQSQGQVRLRRVTVEDGAEVGLFVDHGTLRLEDVTVTGHEYGVQALQATLEARRLTARAAVRAGVALVGARGVLEDTRVVGSGAFGAVSLVASDTVMRDTRVEGADAYGIAATRGRLRLERALLTGLTSREGDSGDGLHLRDVDVEVRGLVVRGAAGVGVLAAQGARVVLRDSSLESCRVAGLWGETLARVTAERLSVRSSGGPALVALDEGVLRVDGLVSEDNAGGLAAAADCTKDTRITFSAVSGRSSTWTPAPCVGPARP